MKLFLCVSSEEFLTVAKPIHESGFLQNKKEKEREAKLNEWKDTQELVLFGNFFSLTVVCLSSCQYTVLQTIVLASLPSQDVINYYY